MNRRDNAHKHNIKPSLVTRIIHDYKRDPSYINKKRQKEDDGRATVAMIKAEYDSAKALSGKPLSSP